MRSDRYFVALAGDVVASDNVLVNTRNLIYSYRSQLSGSRDPIIDRQRRDRTLLEAVRLESKGARRL